MKKIFSILLALAGSTAALPAAAGEQPRLLAMVHWDASVDRDELMDAIAKGNAIDRKLGCDCILRLWEESFGGDGGLTLTIEFKSLLAMAQYRARVADAPEWKEWYKEVDGKAIGRGTNKLLLEITSP